MNILLITARKINFNMAGTTEIELVKSLRRNGNKVTICSPDSNIKEEIMNHIEIKYSRKFGMESYSGGKYLEDHILPKLLDDDNFDIVLIDWRYVQFIHKSMVHKKINWIIIDRGPPAYRGPKALIQTYMWNKAWKIAENYASGGIVVSNKHELLVRSKISNELQIFKLPAGVDFNKYFNQKTYKNECIKIVYVGELRKERGINSIIKLSKIIKRLNYNYKIDIYGEGPYEKQINKNLSDALSFKGKINRRQISVILKDYHIGLMPMPDKMIWNISSPLKLSEYLASGLLIMGPRHSGNMVEGDYHWPLLMPSEDWEIKGLAALERLLNSGNWEKYSKISSSIGQKLSWDIIAKKLEIEILKLL